MNVYSTFMAALFLARVIQAYIFRSLNILLLQAYTRCQRTPFLQSFLHVILSVRCHLYTANRPVPYNICSHTYVISEGNYKRMSDLIKEVHSRMPKDAVTGEQLVTLIPKFTGRIKVPLCTHFVYQIQRKLGEHTGRQHRC